MQHEFLTEMLKICQENGIHIAMETTGFSDKDALLKAAEHLDLIFYDIKHMDDSVHREVTGVSNDLILKNLRELSEVHDNITVRIPVIPGINDSDENLKATAELTASLGIGHLELLPYHNLGEVKYGQIGREYSLSDVKTPDEARMAAIADMLRAVIGDRKTAVSVQKSL